MIEEKFDIEKWIEKMKARGYNVYQDATCPSCRKRAVSMVKGSVIHAKCSTCKWSDSGFGGPSVHSWGEAVRRTYGVEGTRFVEQEKAAGRY